MRTLDILEIIIKNKAPSTAAQILDSLVQYDDYPTYNHLSVTLLNMKRRGWISVARSPCECCKKQTAFWSATEQGRIYYTNYIAK